MMDKKRWLAGLLTVMLTFNTCVGSVQADFGDGTEAVTETVQEESTENVNEDSSDLEEEEASAETAEDVQTEESDTEEDLAEDIELEETEESIAEDEGDPLFTDGEDAEEFSDSNVEENAVYVGTTVIADEESATMGADWLHAFSTFDDAYAQVEDGGTIYVVGQVTIDHWPATANGKNVTISAFYSEKPENLADKYAENYQKTMVSKIAIGGDIVFSGDTVFSGWNYTDSSKSKKLYITNADNKNHEIYPEGHKLQIGSIDSSSRPYDDVEIIDYNSTRRGYANLHITTELKDTSKAENAGVIDLRFYGNNKYYISNYNSHTDSVFYGYDSVNLEIIGTDAGSYSVNQNGGWGNNSRAYIKNASYTNAVLPSLSEKTKSVTVEFRNFQTDGAVHIHTEKGTKQEYLTPANYTEKQSYTHGYIGSTFTVGSYYTTQDAEINLNDIYLSGIFCQNIWHSVCEKLTYNMVNTTIARIRGQWQNSGYAGSMSKNVLTVNMNNSKILDEAYLYTDYEPENGYSVVINASGTSSIGGEIYTRASDSIKLNIDSNSSFSDKLSDFQMDIAIADGGTLILPSGEARCKKIESTGTANIRLQPVSRFRIRDSISGNYKISIAGITGIADAGKTTSLNCSWSAGSAGEATEVTYAGNDADEAITAITNKDNGSYYSEDWSVITDSSAIYVKDSGSDTNDGSSYWNAVSTLSKAYEMAVKSNKSKIIVCGKVSYGNDVKKYTNGVWNLFQSEDSSKEMITVTSVATAGDGNTQKFEEGYIELVPVTKSAANMPSNFNYINNLCQMIKFENISLVSSSSSANIFANGNKLIIGENVTTPLGTALYGGSLGEGVSSTDLTVESGTYGTINGGCVKKDSSSTLTIGGDVSVKVTGATFSVADGESKYVSDKAWAGNVIGSGPGIVKGNISVEVDGTNGTVKKPIQIIGLASRGNYELAYAKDVVAEGQVSVSVKDVNFANSTISAVIGVWDGWADHVDVSVSDCNSAYSYSVMAYNSYYRGGIEQKENGTASIHISGSSNIAGVFGNSNYNSGTPEKLNGKLSVNIKNSSVDKIYLGNGNFTENGISASAGVASDRKVFSSAELNITDSDITDINGLNYGSDNYVEDYNRTADIKGKCSISGEVYGFNGFSSGDESAKSSLKFSGKVLQAEKSAFVNTDATFLQSCSIMGNYEAKEAVTFRIGQNGTLSFNGKIEGSTRLCSVNSIETATVRVLDYSLENVPRQTNAFTGENIEFAQENSIAVWTIEGKDPREKREVIYVRDAVEGESTLDSDQENYIKEHDGSGYESAVQTIEEAYRLLDTSSGSSTIVVCGKLTVKNNYVTPECEGKVYWTSVNGETDYRTQEENPAFLFLSGKNSAYLGINSDLLIQNINICYESTGSVGIDANGNELCIGTNLGTEESKAQVSDVKITPAVDGQMGTGNPQNFYAIGAGVYSSQVDQVQMELHNTAVGGIIILYGEVTVGSKEVPGSVEVTVRDTDLLQGKYYISGYESGAISTSTVYGEMTVSEELYSRDLLTFVEPTLGQNTIVTGDATRNYVNKTSYTKTFDWTKFENYVNTEKNVTLLVDGKDTQRINDSTASFKTTYLMPLTGTLTKSENINIILLGNIIIDNQYWIWEPEKINEKGSLRLQLGDRERGSYVTLRNFLSDNGPKTTERVKKSIRIEVYPGTRIGSSQDNYISADNYTENSEYKWPVCTTEEGYPMFVFYGSEAEPTPTYHIRKMRDFSIEADGCSVLNEDAQSVISSLSLKNGGSYEETFNTSGSITLKKSRLADTEQIIGGGNLSVSGEKNQLADITGFSVEGDCTIENAELNVEGENSFGSITGIGNASLNAEPGSTITTGKINADKILLNCSSEEAPTAANGKLPVSVTVNAADVNENLVQAGVTANGTQIEALEFVKNADSVVWTMGNENTDSYRIFISDSGDDSKSGMDAADAVKTFNRAFEIIQTLDVKPSEENSTSVYHVIVCGTIDWKQEISGFDPEGCQVVVEPLSKRYRKIKIEDFICFPASVTLKNFEFIGSDTLVSPAAVYAEGHSLTIGTENTTEGYVSLYGGCSGEGLVSEKGYELTVESGEWYRVFGAGKNQPVKITDPNGKIVVNLGNADQKSAPTICSPEDQDQGISVYGAFGGGENENAQVTGNTEVHVLYGEKYSNIYGAGWKASQTGNTTIQISGNSVIRRIYGASYQSSLTGSTEIKMDSGIVNRIYGGGSVEDEATVTGNTKVILGCGSDASENQKAVVKDYIRGSGDRAGVTGTSELLIQDGTEIPVECNVSAGGYKGGVGKSILTVTGGTLNCDVYAGGAGAYRSGTTIVDTSLGIVNSSEVKIRGGSIEGNVFAGGNMGYVGSGTSANQILSRVDITGGTVKGNLYGGCNIATTYGNTELLIDGGNIEGSVFGGGKGAGSIAAKVTGETSVKVNKTGVSGSIYGGCDTNGTVSDSVVEVKVLPDCNIFGAGYGQETMVTDTASIKLDAEDIDGKGNAFTVYGGGEQGKANKTVLNIQNWTGDVFGGGKGVLRSSNGIVRTFLRIFESSDLIDAHVETTKVTIHGIVYGNVFGGGEYATVGTTNENASEDVISTDVSEVTVNGTVNGKVYGGGKGEKDHDYAAVNGSTLVTLGTGGVVEAIADSEDTTGAVFGGGQNAPVAGNTEVKVTDGTYSMVYGGNDISGTIHGTAQVKVSGGIVTEVYAGGYGADTEKASAEVTGGNVETLFGGGNAATVTESTKITVDTNKNTDDQTQHVKTLFAGNNKAAMAIQPTLLLSGKIGEAYGGGNEGVMKCKDLQYSFDYPNADIGTVYAGCRNTREVTSDVELTLVSGRYGTVYGGNNVSGYMNETNVVVDASSETGKTLSVNTVYGGGNHADSLTTNVTVNNGKVTTVYGGGNLAETKNANVNLQKGNVTTVYGGGNAASVTGSVNISSKGSASEQISVTDLYCGNNAADMGIAPIVDLQAGTITNFYGGGNKGAMICSDGVQYTLDSDKLSIDTVYGGGNEAGVAGTAELTIGKGNYTTVYGGSNSKGHIEKSIVNIRGNVGKESSDGLTGKIFGGGRGNATEVDASEVNLQDGKIAGNVYGGSGFGKVTNASVTAKEKDNGKVQMLGNIYGAGYGDSSFVGKTEVDISLGLVISDNADTSADVTVEEKAKDAESISGESYAKASWNNKSYADGSYIAGNVFGGGDMGQVGSGHINASTNTADISEEGATKVKIQSGYIRGNVFGGGNGQPGGQDEEGNSISVYNLYMGTVFGTSNVTMTGGYVNGSIFGCGQQSRTYSSGSASNVAITADNTKVLLIGGSIFGGGNKGNGSTQNASVATVYGDTHVNITGVKGQNTRIYMLSTETTGGGVYGDGNLCLVSGKKYVSLTDFSCGIGSNVKLLKTFYSLQRADEVDLTGSRIVLLGAVDLVADNADDTQYSINRVGQMNLKKNSTIKVTKTVNLLAELTSDEQQDRQFIDRGNNNGNAEITGNDYTADGGKAPDDPLTTDEVQKYREAYAQYMENGSESTVFSSINVVCVANGGYLEVKKSTAEYGPVTGLFTLQLVNANPGEGGGFVYADIKGKKIAEGKYVTGNFVCVTKVKDSGNDYMHAYHNVGGRVTDDRYEYYVWYLKGNKYNYDVDLTAYIGTSDTDFTKEISLPVETTGYKYVLMSLKQQKEVSGFEDERFKNIWDVSTDSSSDKISVEVKLVKTQRASSSIKEVTTEIGFLGYQTTDGKPDGNARTTDGKRTWGIWRKGDDDTWKFQECKDEGNSFAVRKGDALGEIDTDTVGVRMQFTLHKGTGMTEEFRNLPFAMEIAAVSNAEYDKGLSDDSPQIQLDSCILLTENITLSAIRLVPSQAAYLGSGRMFGGISSSATANITDTSSVTMQFITKYIPSAFNSGSQNQIEETLVTGYSDTYLLDKNGVGYTIKEDADGIKILNKVNAGDNTITDYVISKDNDGQYQVTYTRAGDTETVSCTAFTQSSGFTLPVGTVVTLLASMDEGTPTYWYYYCTKDTTEISLKDFKKMNTSNADSDHETVYSTIASNSSSRVTENMIFVFDFSNVSDSRWKDETATGTAILRHTYQANGQSADIMDYVSVDKTAGGDQVSYTHEAPKQTDLFEVSKKSDGIRDFRIDNTDGRNSYQQKDQMNLQIEIDPDNSVTNTQFEERQYAVRLHLMKADANGEFSTASFPEGTTFNYDGKRLALEDSNKSVTIPVGIVGTHKVKMTVNLEGMDTGEYKLVAGLYSTSAAGYYNSITVDDKDESDQEVIFQVMPSPEYALKVSETGEGMNHLVKAGDELAFKVAAVSKESTDAENVQVNLYQHENGTYKVISLESVLDGQNEITPCENPGTPNWTPKITSNAQNGTYRLEFIYHNRTEYWDFIVTS